MVTEQALHALATQLGDCLKAKGMKLAAAESCTGGLLAKIITDLSGCSAWFEGSIVSYSNEFKHSVLGVSEAILNDFGAVSGETVQEMCEGVFTNTQADVAVSISGIAGPDGGSEDKPVGLVWMGWGERNKDVFVVPFNFAGNREAVRLQAVEIVINELIVLLGRSE